MEFGSISLLPFLPLTTSWDVDHSMFRCSCLVILMLCTMVIHSFVLEMFLLWLVHCVKCVEVFKSAAYGGQNKTTCV
jgi:hypothetical protein